MARFITDGHGVPAGTEVKIVDSFMSIHDEQIVVVERCDGGLLPGPCDAATRANVAAEFIG